MSNAALAENIAIYCKHLGFALSDAPGTVNLVYIEGCNEDGTPNADLPNMWNDRRMILFYQDGWNLKLNVTATTEPGDYYTQNPMNKKGASRIAFGQYWAWRFGLHKKRQPALVQVAPVLVHRDINKDGKRSPNDPMEWGIFGIDHHTTNKTGKPPALIGKHSAGCPVGWKYLEHLLFLEIMATDLRYQDAKKDYLFDSIFLAGDKMQKFIQTLK